MMFDQLCNREGLRELIVAFEAHLTMRDLFDKTNFNDVKDQFDPLITGLFD